MSGVQGKVAVVTGAASGIGRAVTMSMVEHGAVVVATDVNADKLAAVVEAAGGSTVAVEGDLRESSTIDRLVAAADEAGGASILVNNAGVMDYFLPAGDVDDDTWDWVMSVNVTAPMRLTRALLPGMVERRQGSIVNVASIGGLTGGAAGLAYTASKHALVGMTRNTAFFYGPQGVRCNVVCPAGVETNIAEGGATPRAPWAWERVQTGFGRAQRMAQPEEIASLILHLAGEDAINMNGAVIPTDGGWTAA